MDMSDIWKLARLLRQNGDKVLNEGSKFSLTASLLRKLNDAFLIIVDREELCSAFQVVSVSHEQDELFHNLHFLHDFVQKVLALKVDRDYPARAPLSRSCALNVAKFKSLRYLEIRKVPVHSVTGLQELRPQLHAIVCVQCVHRLEELLSRCGGDQSGDSAWDELREAVFSYNSLTSLDSSLSLAPWLQVLDLSHNNLRTGEGLELLPCLRYLNLGYNCLVSVPVLSEEACTKLQTLILKNNFIESAAGLAGLDSLAELDLSCNMVARYDSLRALRGTPALATLCLDGNPLCFCADYRARVAETLHHNTAFNQFVLDGMPLSKLERLRLGSAVNGEEVVAPSRPPESTEGAQPTTVASGLAKVQRGKKASRMRVAVISEQLGAEERKAAREASPSSHLELSTEHLEVKKQVEMLRERFGEDDWLHHLGGSRLQDVLGIERAALPDLGRALRGCLGAGDDGMQVETETGLNSPGQAPVVGHLVSDDHVVAASEGAVPESPTPEESALERFQPKEPSLETAVPKEPQVAPLQESQEEEPVEEADDDLADVKLYLVQKHRPGVDILDELFLVVTDSHVKERDSVSGKTKERWTMETLLSCTKTSNDPVTVQLTFDTVRRDRQERLYIMDEEDAEQLMRALSEILDSRSLTAMNQVAFRCFKCQSQFAQELGPKVTAQPESVMCPTCGSSVVIIMDEVPLPSNVSAAREEPPKAAEPTNGVSTMTKCPSECSIGPESDGADTLRVTAVVHSSSSPVDCARPSTTLRSASSLNQSPERSQDGAAATAARHCDSDIEIISNPSQSSIEVLDDSGRVRGSTPARKSSSEEKTSMAAVPQLSSVKGMIMTESSSSGSLADSVCTTYENPPGASVGDSSSPAPRMADGDGSAKAPNGSESPDDTLKHGEGKRGPPRSVPEVGVTYTSVLEDLMQSVTSRIPAGPGETTARSAASEGIRYSYDDFSDVDHRARMVRHHSNAPYMGLLVFSTSKIYVLQITGPESDEPQDWLMLEDSWPASGLRAVSLLPSEQGVSLEFSNPGGAGAASYLAVLQYCAHTTQFYEFLSGLSLPDDYKVCLGGTSDRHILLIQQLTLTMPTDEDSDLALQHLVIFSRCIVRRGSEEVKALRVGVFVLTGTALLVTEEGVDWLFPGSSASPQPGDTQSMSSLVELEMEGLCLTLHFLEESTQCSESWVIAVDSREMVDTLASSVMSLWEDLFSVPLQVVDKNGGSNSNTCDELKNSA
ncbi:serine/threonine-protein kinase 11-interacting protein isoform X2 [Bacillus rossius redtenbacheri]|uniref:serine/threonine-protein kinase 11-interacting protein isoform X2 n=1 Tax=Bacillus rossius redtenbacheri TaxID=93214 RepID=UPI002FDE7889